MVLISVIIFLSNLVLSLNSLSHFKTGKLILTILKLRRTPLISGPGFKIFSHKLRKKKTLKKEFAS